MAFIYQRHWYASRLILNRRNESNVGYKQYGKMHNKLKTETQTTTKKLLSNVPQAFKWKREYSLNSSQSNSQSLIYTISSWNKVVEINAEPHANWKKRTPLNIFFKFLNWLQTNGIHLHLHLYVVFQIQNLLDDFLMK